MFESWYDTEACKARPISDLIAHFAVRGTEGSMPLPERSSHLPPKWNAMDPKARADTLMNYRIAYLGNTMVNWCPKLGTVSPTTR